MRLKVLLVLLQVTLASHSFCQMQFRHLTSADGISQSEVYSFLEDDQGFMWFGTVDGLNRYDGYTVSTFNINKDNPNSIANNTIRCLAEDAQGRIWIGTDDGLCVYDSRLEKISQLQLDGLTSDRLTVSTSLIRGDSLYLGTSAGFLRLNVQSPDITVVQKTPVEIKASEQKTPVHVIAKAGKPSGITWIITTDKLYQLHPATSSIHLELDLSKSMPDLRNLEVDSLGNLWIVSHDHGFLRYSPSTKHSTYFTKETENNSIVSTKFSSVCADKDGNLWLGTHDKGLLFLAFKFLNEQDPSFEHIEHDPFNDRSLNSNLVYSLYNTKDNLLWIGTIGAGINIYNPNRKPFQYFNLNQATKKSAQTNFIRAVYADELGTLWIGTHNNGLFFLDRDNNNTVSKVGFGTEPIFHINTAPEGKALVCTGQGISLVEKRKNELTVLSSLAFGPSFFVTSVEEGSFWVASLNGIKKCTLRDNTISLTASFDASSTPAIPFENCRVLFFDSTDNKLYVGTEGGGLNVLSLSPDGIPMHNDIYKKSPHPGSLSNNYVRSIAKDQDANLWIGTYEGLNKLSKEASGKINFSSYTDKDGLPNNTIQSIAIDQQDKLWIGTNKGLCKFDPATKQFLQYTLSDGLQSNEFSEHTVFKKSDDEIIIGGINGINTFYPEKISSSGADPNLIVTDLFLFNQRVEIEPDSNVNNLSPLKKSISKTDTLLLNPDQHSFGFGFSAINFNAPEKIQYAYRLVGFDESWNYTNSTNRRANYTNLGYGDYTFEIKATDSDGTWMEVPKRIYISIKTPVYLTTFAFVLYGLALLAGIYFFTNYSILRHTIKNKLLLENQHNKKVRELEELRSRFFTNISHDLRTPLTLISGPLGVLFNSTKDNSEEKSLLALMQRNVNKLKDMTEQLLDITKMEAGNLSPAYQTIDVVSFIKEQAGYFENAFSEKGIQLELTSEEKSLVFSVDPDMLSKVMFNLLSNALKYTRQGKVSISIVKVAGHKLNDHYDQPQEQYVEIRVADSGEGIAKEDHALLFDRFYQGESASKKGYGIGLSHTKDLITAHQGHIRVESERGFGASFIFYLPYFQQAEAPRQQQATRDDEILESSEPGGLAPVFSKEENIDLHNQTILLVEDNDDLRSFMANELRKRYTVIEAQNGAEGISTAKEAFPDLIVSDVMMPNKDGIEFCKEIKSTLKTSHIPVILLTAKIDKETRFKGLEIGADDYISKPFELDYLLLRIQNLLENRARMRELFRVDTSFEPSKITVTSIDEEFLSKLMAEIEKGLPDAAFSISSLEQEMGMSHASFYNKIKGLTGQSAKELVLSMRMKRAKQLIEDTANIRISEVAYMVGFTDPKYFSKSFKEYFGSSPSSFSKAT